MPELTHDERYEVRRADAERALKTMAVGIEDELPDGMGFALLLFDFGPNGALFYISNAQRADMLNTMKEFIAKWEAKRG